MKTRITEPKLIFTKTIKGGQNHIFKENKKEKKKQIA